jgi:hypothetical protein
MSESQAYICINSPSGLEGEQRRARGSAGVSGVVISDDRVLCHSRSRAHVRPVQPLRPWNDKRSDHDDPCDVMKSRDSRLVEGSYREVSRVMNSDSRRVRRPRLH